MAAVWSGSAEIKGSSETMRMILLTFNTIGVVFTWGIEMTYCTLYLIHLGLSKSNTSLVWLAGPLSGLMVQPIIGAIADRCTSRFGRRRPFIMGGSIAVALSLIVLGFTEELVGWIYPVSAENPEAKETARRLSLWLAVLSIYAVDFSINAVMSSSRSLIVDTLPIEKQQLGAAWAGRLHAIGHLIGYGACALDLPQLLGPTLGDTQFKQLVVMAVVAILASSSVTCWAVTERVLVTPSGGAEQDGPVAIFRRIWGKLMNLPPRIQALCNVQFWAWIGWFPFLFYSSMFVGETYFRYDFVPSEALGEEDRMSETGRIGSFALVLYSGVTFVGAGILPLLVKSPDEDTSYTKRPPQQLAGWLNWWNKVKPDLLTAWVAGNAIFSIAMFLTPFAQSFRVATALVALCGLPWSIVLWAPVTFLGVEVNRLSAPSLDGEKRDDDRVSGASSDGGELSGIYFGIMNIYSTLPQFLSSFISAVIFAIFEPGKASAEEAPSMSDSSSAHGGVNAVAVCLCIGGVSTLYASYITTKIRGRNVEA